MYIVRNCILCMRNIHTTDIYAKTFRRVGGRWEWEGWGGGGLMAAEGCRGRGGWEGRWLVSVHFRIAASLKAFKSSRGAFTGWVGGGGLRGGTGFGVGGCWGWRRVVALSDRFALRKRGNKMALPLVMAWLQPPTYTPFPSKASPHFPPLSSGWKLAAT